MKIVFVIIVFVIAKIISVPSSVIQAWDWCCTNSFLAVIISSHNNRSNNTNNAIIIIMTMMSTMIMTITLLLLQLPLPLLPLPALLLLPLPLPLLLLPLPPTNIISIIWYHIFIIIMISWENNIDEDEKIAEKSVRCGLKINMGVYV